MDWNGDQVLTRFRDQYAILVGVAGEGLSDQMKSLIGILGPPRSSPGDPPHVETGRLRESVHSSLDTSNPDHPTAHIGSSVPYGKFLEMGTTKMEARPWCLRAFKEGRPQITQNLTGHR